MREKLTICCKWLSNLQDVQLDNYKTQMKQTNLNDASLKYRTRSISRHR